MAVVLESPLVLVPAAATIYINRPPNSTSSIGLGISNGGNASLFVDNQVAMPLTTPHANFIEHPPEKVNHVIADRNQALSEIYGAGYVPESGFETIAVVAIGTAAKQLVQDGIEFASTVINVWGDAHASIYSASDTHRLEALHRNQERFEKVGQVVSHVAKNPGAIVTHYENKVQLAANSFTAAQKHGDMVGAGKAAGHILADVYTISTIGTGVAKVAAKATSRAAKATSNFAKTHDFRAPMTFHYDGSRLNSGIPLDVIKLQNPVVKKTAPVTITDTVNLNVQKLLWPFIQESFNTDNLVLRNVVLTICIMLLCIAIDIILAPVYGMISTYLINKLQKNSVV